MSAFLITYRVLKQPEDMRNKAIVHFALYSFFMFIFVSVRAQCNRISDSLELVKLYQSTGGSNWKIKWDLKTSYDKWYGVQTDSNGCVFKIGLIDNGLINQIPELNLPMLNWLLLSENNLSGLIPDFNLPRLKILELNNNKLSGFVSDLDLPELNKLDLSYNNLTGQLPEFKSPKLSIIDLTSNQLSGEIPDFNFPDLKIFRLTSNNFAGEIPRLELPNLIEMNLSINQLSGEIPDFNFPDLEVLGLAHNKLSGQIPNFNLPKLKNLYLEYNQLSGEIPDFNFPDLEVLTINKNQLIGQIPNLKFLKLSYLRIDNNKLTGSIPNFNLPNLWVLNLSDNKLSGNIPDFNLNILFELNLSNNQLSGEIPEFELPNLKELTLSNNRLTGSIPNFKSTSVLYLNLSLNQLTGEIPEFNFPNLIKLKLSNNRLEGVIPKLNAPNLEYLNLSDNHLTGPIPDFLPSTLKQLYLSNNNLSGTVGDFEFPRSASISIDGNNFVCEPLKINIGKLANYTYSPQRKFYRDTSFDVVAGSDLKVNLEIDSSLTDSKYLWQNIDNPTWSMDPLQNNRSNTYNFTDIQLKDAGRYFVKVSNLRLPELTLESYTISVRVCDVKNDSLELVKLYNGTHGDDWNRKDNWLIPGQAISSWYGITATNGGCVQSIVLENNGLRGQLPGLNLNTLDTLNLSNNGITGNIPALNTPFIKYLKLRNNMIEGVFSPVMKSWKDIAVMDLGENIVSEVVPPFLGSLTELQELKLDHNLIFGELPDELSKLHKLQIGRVDFSTNYLNTFTEKIIFFCPFGDRFIKLCGNSCKGDEWSNINSIPWIRDTLNTVQCMGNEMCIYANAEAGFVEVKGNRLIYIQTVCCRDDGCNTRIVETKFYDCSGNLIETVLCQNAIKCNGFGIISNEDLDTIRFDKRWSCCDTLDITIGVKDAESWGKKKEGLVEEANCFPNPVNDILRCDVDDLPKEIFIYNLQGSRMPTNGFNMEGSRIVLDCSHLISGIYFIRLLSENKVMDTKIVVRIK